jgi:hypothetical protein
LESSEPSFGHSKGSPITTGAEGPVEAADENAGSTEPLATAITLTDGGLVIEAGINSVVETFVATGLRGENTPEPTEFVV